MLVISPCLEMLFSHLVLVMLSTHCSESFKAFICGKKNVCWVIDSLCYYFIVQAYQFSFRNNSFYLKLINYFLGGGAWVMYTHGLKFKRQNAKMCLLFPPCPLVSPPRGNHCNQSLHCPLQSWSTPFPFHGKFLLYTCAFTYCTMGKLNQLNI